MIAVAMYCAAAGYFFGAWHQPLIDDWGDTALVFVAAWCWPLMLVVILTQIATAKWRERFK